MGKKPFFNCFMPYYLYSYKRSRYNPMRYIFGERYWSKKIPDGYFDTSDIKIIKKDKTE
tara:strand:- start:1249 stop:1425 length:177 start_codon:yes stop_codon:yes gene_type:complete